MHTEPSPLNRGLGISLRFESGRAGSAGVTRTPAHSAFQATSTEIRPGTSQ